MELLIPIIVIGGMFALFVSTGLIGKAGLAFGAIVLIATFIFAPIVMNSTDVKAVTGSWSEAHAMVDKSGILKKDFLK